MTESQETPESPEAPEAPVTPPEEESVEDRTTPRENQERDEAKIEEGKESWEKVGN